MAVYFDPEKRIFTLQTKNSTYQMQADKYQVLLHLYYGKRTEGSMDYLLTYADRGFSGNIYDAGTDRTYSLDALPQEFPVWGMGDLRINALNIRGESGAFGCDLRYQGHEILSGKYGLKGLPAVYAEDEEAQTLKIVLFDKVKGLHVTLLYGVLPELDIITRAVILKNDGKEKLKIEKVLSANLDMVSGDYDVMTFYGRHTMERVPRRTPAGHGIQMIGSRRGMSSHQYNPMMILMDREASEDAGRCWSMQFVYSGSFQAAVERDQYSQTRMQMGLMDEQFSYPLNPGEEFTAPEVIMSFSGEGLSRLSRNLHSCIRSHVCRGKYRDSKRHVLLNSWEAAYFDFDGEKILRIAKEARELGIEMLVMDDGWFGERTDDNRSLGDWEVNEKKLGCSLKELGSKIHEMGMKFGIWIEPEMVNENSRLFREHPDWALALPGYDPVRARNQLVLDFSRKEVEDGIFDLLTASLDEGDLDYIKWDYNRGIYDIYSHTAEDQGKVSYDYILGLYSFLERLRERYPDMLIEGCSGGGGRFDAGMLYYTPQIWGSDNSDAVDRLRIQYGTSFGYPASTVGSHVSVSPNEQNGRVTPLETRSAVAMAGVYGFELDPARMSDAEKETVREQVRDYHRYEDLVLKGDYYRLSDPLKDCFCGWIFVSADQSEALMTAVTLEVHGNMAASYIRPKGLKAGCFYREERSGKIYPADALMDTGMPLPLEKGEYHAYVYHFVLEKQG